jgi:Putative zinc- or iron-chelating domain
MGKTHSQADAELQALYDQVPDIPECDGRCQISCGPLDMSTRERQRIRAAGVRITPGHEALARAGTFWCEALRDGRCSVYELRPMVCRLWGATEDMPCPYGCVPAGGHLPARVGVTLLARSVRAGGGGPPEMNAMTGEEFEAAVAGRWFQQAMGDAHAAGRAGVRQRVVPPAFRRPGGPPGEG